MRKKTMAACMLRTCFLVLVWGFLFIPTNSWGTEQAFEFTGAVTSAIGTPYGTTVPATSSVSGHFVFESNITEFFPVSGCTGCKAYYQRHVNGLNVQFAGLSVQADEYIIQIKNDVSIMGVVSDAFTILYQSTASPALQQFLINGSPVAAGLLRMEMVAPSSTFSDASLPMSLDPTVFNLSGGIRTFGDGVPTAGSVDLLFSMQTLTSTPYFTSDHDLDGDVDGNDFLIWQRHAGTTTSNGDTNSDLMVDGTDLADWEAQYDAVPPLAAADAVPEPSSFAFVGAALLAFVSRRRSSLG